MCGRVVVVLGALAVAAVFCFAVLPKEHGLWQLGLRGTTPAAQSPPVGLSAASNGRLPVEMEPRCRVVRGRHPSRGNGVQYRCLANVFLIGGSKCGTSFTRNVLDLHPRLSFIGNPKKPGQHEVHRFDMFRKPGHQKMLQEWRGAPLVQSAQVPVLHYTPNYVFAPLVPFDLRRLYPRDVGGIKFVVMLREPVSRLQSSYWFKNSHTGSMDGLWETAMQEIADRTRYDACRADVATRALADGERLVPNGWTLVSPATSNGSSTSVQWWHFTQNTTIVAQIERIRSLEEAALRQCWTATSRLRGRALKLQHVDKSIFVDQLFRWFLNFPPASINGVSAREAASKTAAAATAPADNQRDGAEPPRATAPVAPEFHYHIFPVEDYYSDDNMVRALGRLTDFMGLDFLGDETSGLAASNKSLLALAASVRHNANPHEHLATERVKKLDALVFRAFTQRLRGLLAEVPNALPPSSTS